MLSITPVSIWTPAGLRSATQFNVRAVNYSGGTAQADCQLLDAQGHELSSQLVAATAEQCDAWTDDDAFYAVLAENAGLTPA
jgi:hypothetical protein